MDTMKNEPRPRYRFLNVYTRRFFWQRTHATFIGRQLSMANGQRPNLDDLLERTVRIQTIFGNGTALAIDHGERQYLVTAKHVVAIPANQVLANETIRVNPEVGHLGIATVKDVLISPDDPDTGGIDVAVVELSRPIPFTGQSPNLGKPEDLYVTQHVGMSGAEHWDAFTPSVGITTRTGSVAKIIQPEHRGPYTGDFLVDMEAYQGFSGSPVFDWDQEGHLSVVGIAARLSWRLIPAFGTSPVHTGLIGCFHIERAIELIGSAVP